jgi:propionyl-CoA carboxylase alpha chain
VNVSVGQEVQEGQSLCVVEAMKMENVLRAEKKGKIKSINTEPGMSLAVDETIIEFE